MTKNRTMFISGDALAAVQQLKLEHRLKQWRAENGGRGRHVSVPEELIPEVQKIRERLRIEKAEAKLKKLAAQVKAMKRSAGLSA